MAASTSAQILARLAFSTVNNVAVGAAPNAVFSSPVNVDIPGAAVTSLPNGTAAGQVGVGWADTRTLAATSVTLDLTALAATATNSGAASFATLVGILIINNAAIDSANSITVGNAASTQAPFNGVGSTSTVVIKPGGSYQFFDPSTLGQVVSTNKSLKIDAGAGTASVTIVLVGR